MKVTGGCFCSAIRYEAEVDENMVIICHCTDCQINSGTAYGVVVGVINGKFNLIQGNIFGITSSNKSTILVLPVFLLISSAYGL